MNKKTELLLRLYKKFKPIWERFERRILQEYETQKANEILARRHPKPETQGDRKQVRAAFQKRRPTPDQCKHLKGNRLGLTFYRKDYNLSCHTFADTHTEVKCLTCGKLFDLKDPETHRMLESTTNSPSSSEVVLRLEKRS